MSKRPLSPSSGLLPWPDAARYAGCSIRTLDRAAEAGKLTVAGRRGGTGVRYVRLVDLHAWMLGTDAGPVPTRPPPPVRHAAPRGDALERIARTAAGKPREPAE